MLKKCRNPMERNATVLRKITGFMFTFGWHATLRITKALAERVNLRAKAARSLRVKTTHL